MMRLLSEPSLRQAATVRPGIWREQYSKTNCYTYLPKMQPWLWLLATILFGAYALLWVRLRRARALLAHLPSLPQLPLIGNLLQFYGGGECLFRRLDQMSTISEEKMLPFVVWFGPKPIINGVLRFLSEKIAASSRCDKLVAINNAAYLFPVCHDPDDVSTISNTLIEKPYYYSFGKIWLGDGLVLAPASIWKQTVKKLAGVFTVRVVEGYQGVFNAEARTLVDRLRAKAGAQPFDIMQHLALTTLEAICQTALGVTRIADSVEKEKYYSAFNRTLELFIARGLNLLTHPDCLYKLTTAHRELVDQVAVLHNVSDTVLKKRKADRVKKGKTEHGQETKDVKFRSILDLLLDIGESDPLFSEQQIKSEVDTIILGGQETVASAVYYTLLMIGCRPDVQNKLYTEIRSIFGDSTRPVEKKDLGRMAYCEAVLNETLRLFPPVPVVMRNADKEITLKSCTVPIGTGCALNVWGAGRSKHSWGPDALEYKPERWLDGDTPSTAAAFLAFSYGRRACIGKRYALVILKTILAYCVRELEFFSEADKLQFKVDVALRPVAGHLIQIKLR